MSLAFRAGDAARWTAGRLAQGRADAIFHGASIDTRGVAPGQLFVAIRGAQHDAHDFLAEAVARGAAGLLIERGRTLPAEVKPELPVVEVKDTTLALGALAAGHRTAFEGPLVAITGSNGKTTTKEMCAAILGVRTACLKTEGNLNNQFGLPLTLLRRAAEHRSIVVEIGMNHRGEIAPLAAIARPNVGVITNVGTAHIENMGSQHEIALEKGDLVAALPASGAAVLNADDALVMRQAARTRARVVRFGFAGEAEVRAEGVSSVGERGVAFDLVTPAGRAAVHVAGLGSATASNALAAAAAALAAGARLEDVAVGLARYRPLGGRMERLVLARNIIVINDTYNANPQSMEVALRSLAELKGRSRGFAVLGDMAELGETAPAAHRATGELVAQLGIEFLFALGSHAHDVAAGALAAGMSAQRVHVGEDPAQTSAALRALLQGDDWVLVKGSRSMRMERVVQALSAGEGAA